MVKIVKSMLYVFYHNKKRPVFEASFRGRVSCPE